MIADGHHLFEGKPFGAGLAFALRQGGVGAQHAAQMGRGDGDQVFGDFPDRKPAQAFDAVGGIAAPGQILAALAAQGGGAGKAGGVDRGAQTGGGAGRVQVEIGRRGIGRLGHVRDFAGCAAILRFSPKLSHMRRGLPRGGVAGQGAR